jgi:hypothetical protein
MMLNKPSTDLGKVKQYLLKIDENQLEMLEAVASENIFPNQHLSGRGLIS